AARPGVLTDAHVAALERARSKGIMFAERYAEHYRDQLEREQPGAPLESIHVYTDYLRRSIRYNLDAYEREGLIEFLSRAHQAGLLRIPGLEAADTVHVAFRGATYEGLLHARRGRPLASVDTLLERAAAGERLDLAEGMLLLERADTFALGEAADARRQALHPDGIVTYIIDRNVKYSNLCTARCKFCNFYVPPNADGGYVLSKEVLAQKFAETEALGGVQILLQ